jgi:hypothetical protein
MNFRLSKWIVLASLVVCASVATQAEENKYFKSFSQETFRIETIAQPAVTAAFSNWVTKPAGFGTGAEGFGYHYGVALADNVNGKVMRKLVFAAASRQVDEYHPKESGTFFSRLVNAAGHSIFVDPQAEHKSFNWSALPASFASAGLSNAYQPREQQTWSATLQRAATNSAGYLAGDLFIEFRSAACVLPFLRPVLRCKQQ